MSSPFLGFPCSSEKEGRREGKRKLGFEGFKNIKVWKLSQIPPCLGLCRKNHNKSAFGWFELEFEVD